MIPESKANCYTSEIQIPALQGTKHIKVAINVNREIASLEESIRQLDGEIDIETYQTPIFLAVLRLAAKDLSETLTVSEQTTLYAAYILPKLYFISSRNRYQDNKYV